MAGLAAKSGLDRLPGKPQTLAFPWRRPGAGFEDKTMPNSLPQNSESGDARFFPAFALIWAGTTLIHQLAFTFWTETWQGWILVTATFGVILNPACFRRFTALIVASLMNLGYKMPFVPNHILYEGILHITMLLGILGFVLRGEFGGFGAVVGGFVRRFWPFLIAFAIKQVCFFYEIIPNSRLVGGTTTLLMAVTFGWGAFRGPNLEKGELFFSTIAPVIRIAVVLMYFWAAIQKMNWDYLDPSISCAATLHNEIVEYFPFSEFTSQLWAQNCAIWGSLIFEIGIPILLMLGRFRLLGFLSAIWFHLWLSIHHAAGIFSYSSIVFALLMFFLPANVALKLQEIWARQLRWLGSGDEESGRRFTRKFLIFVFLLTLFVQGALYLILGRTYDTFWIANRVGFTAWFSWGLWLGGCYLVAVWSARKMPRAFPNKAKPTLAWLGLLLVIGNGLNPWFGAKTQTSFSMYSNLRSEAAGNHVFLKRIDLFPYQSDMVEIISPQEMLKPSTRPRGIQQFANDGHIFPYFELQRLLSEVEGPVKVVYRRDGKLHIVERDSSGKILRGDPALFERPPFFLRKYLWFRRHQSLTLPMHCTH